MKRALTFLGVASVGAWLIVAAFAVAMLRRGFSAQEEPSAAEAQLARAVRSAATPARARELKNLVTPTAEILTEARHHWADHCATCHANDGSGDTSIGKHLYPHAPDMRAAPTQQLSDGELYSVIQNGIRLTGMPGWGKPGDENDRETWALVAFIRHLPHATPDELEDMKQMNPKSVKEWREQLEEEQFLKGEAAPEAPNSDPGHKP
jgi:mono/diheme cytochrome c family protein